MLNFGLSEWIPCCIEEFYSQTSIQLFVVQHFKLMKSKHFFVILHKVIGLFDNSRKYTQATK